MSLKLAYINDSQYRIICLILKMSLIETTTSGDRILYSMNENQRIGTVRLVSKKGIIDIKEYKSAHKGLIIVSSGHEDNCIDESKVLSVVNHESGMVRTMYCPKGMHQSIILRNALQKLWKNLVFRRVRCSDISGATNGTIVYTTPTCVEVFPMQESTMESYTEKELERNVSVFYENFLTTTTRTQLRNNDSYSGYELSLHSNNYRELDWEDGSLTFSDKKKSPVEIPRPHRLICGTVDENGSYTEWFTCSEQFYKLWTCIMYGNKVYPSKNTYEQLIMKMRCNTCDLWIKSHPTETEEEKLSKFYCVRTERVSKDYHYLYQALATFIFLPNQFQEKSKKWGKSFPGELSASEWIQLIFERVAWLNQ